MTAAELLCVRYERGKVCMYIRTKKRETREREGERERETRTCSGRARVGVRSKERERQTTRERLSDGTEIDFRASKHNVR